MYQYNNYGLTLTSSFPIKAFKENSKEIDLIINLNNRTVNLNLPSIKYLQSRMQFNGIENILIRIRKDENSIGTIHFLKENAIHSTLCNFEIDYKDLNVVVEFKEFFVDMNFSYDK